MNDPRRPSVPWTRAVGVVVGVVAGAGAVGLATSCIIPEEEIIPDEKLNDHPVRFVEPVVTTLDSRCDCSDATRSAGQEDPCPADAPSSTWEPNDCPQAIPSGIPHLLRPEDFPFCACATGTADADPPPVAGIELFVEDQDRKDRIFPAVFIDIEQPGLTAREDLDPFRLDGYSPESLSPDEIEGLLVIGQEQRRVRALVISDLSQGGFDPCNAGGLDPGWHVLTVLVTDRQWSGLGRNRGSPDFASGATVDTTHYTFFCESPEEAPCDTRCQPVVDG